MSPMSAGALHWIPVSTDACVNDAIDGELPPMSETTNASGGCSCEGELMTLYRRIKNF